MIEVRVKPSSSVLGDFFAWGRAGQIETECPVKEPGDVFFDWADTYDEAYRKVYDEISAVQKEPKA